MRALLLLAGMAVSPLCLADRVQIPLALDHQFIESLLREQVFTRPGGSVRLNDDGSGCQYLELSEPRVSARGDRVFLRTSAEARVGRAVGGRCLLLVDWRGGLELVQEPVVGDDGESVVLRTSSWRALRPDGGTDTVSTTVGRWIEQFLPLDLQRTPISFSQPMSQLRDLLELTGPADDAGPLRGLLDTLSIDGVTAADDRVTVTLGMEAPAAGTPPQGAEPVLTEAELAQLEQQLDAVDAFFTYTIKSVAGGAGEPDAAGLLEVLIELRRELVDILTRPQRRSADPARSLFIESWDALVPALRLAAARMPDHESTLRHLTFIGGGEVLRALDELGPAAGIEISSDGLRRLARILAPGAAADPLERDDEVDLELRRSLGLGEPLPPPGDYDGDSASWLDWLIPRAVAADTLAPSVVERLNTWVPGQRDMKTYLPMVRDVLRHVAAEQLRASELDGEFHPLFRSLVLATAWQESCWRQFVAENDMRVPMRSGSGDLGVMQVNATVWRGIYDLHGLRWDMVYNARAGADILDHYLINYAIRHGEHRTTGSVDNLARSAYAAYNGGPRRYDRYRRADAPEYGRKVDTVFYDKYRQVSSGKELAVTACYGG